LRYEKIFGCASAGIEEFQNESFVAWCEISVKIIPQNAVGISSEDGL
jgi:hypothetical protein